MGAQIEQSIVGQAAGDAAIAQVEIQDQVATRQVDPGDAQDLGTVNDTFAHDPAIGSATGIGLHESQIQIQPRQA